MTTTVLHFDVFTSHIGKGNPAGIVLDGDNIDDVAMQAIAKTVGFGDTAFVSSSQTADFRIRYFSPGKEVELCGHATIAASIALHVYGSLTGKIFPVDFVFETKAGNLPIKIDLDAAGERLVFMSQAPARFAQFNGDRSLLARVLGITTHDLDPALPITYGFTGRWTLVVPVRGLSVMRKIQPQPADFAAVLHEVPNASIHPVCFEVIDANATMHARHFSSPGSGTFEDPVTGTASGVLGAFYRKFVNVSERIAQPIMIEQGYEMGREGCVLVWANPNTDSYDVQIAGTACFVEQLVA
jgi:PhzF family phenazine biosynthesis protein